MCSNVRTEKRTWSNESPMVSSLGGRSRMSLAMISRMTTRGLLRVRESVFECISLSA